MIHNVKLQNILVFGGNIFCQIEPQFTFTEDVEKHMNATLEIQKKTIANVKFELVEILDTKQENMQR